MLLGLLSILVALVLYQLYAWWRKTAPLRAAAAKVHGPPTVPILGNGLLFLGGTYDILTSIDNLYATYSTHEMPVRIWMGPKLYFCISSPNHIETVLNAPEALEKDSRYKFAQVWLGEGIFTAPVPKWRRHRRVIMPSFNQRILETFVPIFTEQTAELVRQLNTMADGKTFDCFHHISRCSLDIVCETVMGVSVGAQCNSDSDFVTASQRQLAIVVKRMFQLWLGNPLLFKLSGLASQQDENLKVIHGFSQRVIETKMQSEKHKTREPSARKSFLDYIIAATQKEDEKAWTKEELREEVDTMIVAGSDTSGSMVCFVLMLLGMHQDVQEKMVEELRSISGTERSAVRVEDLPRMSYMELVVKESMRLFPVGPFIVRQVTQDLKLTDSVTLPRGSGVLVGIRSVQRNKRYWGLDAEEFHPERFLPENSTGRHPYAYVPFSGGPRNCAGQRYALMSMKIMLAAILRHFHVRCDYKMAEIPLKVDLMLRPLHGYKISLMLRDKF